MKWNCIFDDDCIEKKEIQKRIELIYNILISNTSLKTIGVLSGDSGLMLSLLYYCKFSSNRKFLFKSVKIIENIYNKINSGLIKHSFADGISGFAWSLLHIKQENLLVFDCNDFDYFDEFLSKKMFYDIDSKQFDFMHYSLGPALYYIKRERNDILHIYVEKLLNCGIKTNSEIKWRDFFSSKSNIYEMYNVGLSHGIPSIIYFLGKLIQLKVLNKTEYSIYIEKAVDFILNNKMIYPAEYSKDHIKSIFPYYVSPDHISPSTRLAWCYGDLGIGITLLLTSKFINNKKIEKTALEILFETTKRKSISDNGIIDSGLCHGTVGIAHVYARIYNYTGIKTFKESAKYWYRAALNFTDEKSNVAGFKFLSEKYLKSNDIYNGKDYHYHLLEGIGGIGLSLISSISYIEPKWDECLLLS